MEENEIREIKLSVDGKPIGSVRKVYSSTATIDGDTSALQNFLRGQEEKRKKLEAQWMALPEEERLTCCQCVAYTSAWHISEQFSTVSERTCWLFLSSIPGQARNSL